MKPRTEPRAVDPRTLGLADQCQTRAERDAPAAYRASQAAQAAAKARNACAPINKRLLAEAALIGASLDGDALEQGEPE